MEELLRGELVCASRRDEVESEVAKDDLSVVLDPVEAPEVTLCEDPSNEVTSLDVADLVVIPCDVTLSEVAPCVVTSRGTTPEVIA